MMRQYVVTKDLLNIRSRPSDEDDESFIGQLRRDEIVYLEETEVVGRKPKGGLTDIWLKDNYNRFLAKDGLRLSDWEKEKTELLDTLQNTWRLTKGKNIGIALIDCGVISVHPNLPAGMKHVNIPNDGEPGDRHGTRMAGLMVGSHPQYILSFAPEARVADYKIFQENGLNTKENLAIALSQIKDDPQIRVINLSLEFFKGDLDAEEIGRMDQLFHECIGRGKIVVAATGNNKEYVAYPGSNTELITVGAIKNGRPANFPNGIRPENISRDPDCFIELGLWPFCDLTRTEPDEIINSSEATAVMSSLIALKLSLQPGLDQNGIKEQIRRSRFQVGSKPGLDLFKLNISTFLHA